MNNTRDDFIVDHPEVLDNLENAENADNASNNNDNLNKDINTSTQPINSASVQGQLLKLCVLKTWCDHYCTISHCLYIIFKLFIIFSTLKFLQ